MSGVGPGYTVSPPRVETPLHTLLATAAEAPDETSNRWMLGFEFEPDGAIATQAWPGAWCEDDDEKEEKPDDTPPGVISFMPYNLITGYSCPWGRTEEERITKVRAQLALGETKALERELWTGEIDQMRADPTNMSLIRPNAGQVDETAILNPGYDPGSDAPGDAEPVDLITGLALLGQGLADFGTGGRGMIHVTPHVAEVAAAGGLWEEDGRGGTSRLRTKGRGDFVVVGSGYPGTGPGGVVPAAGQVWLHATGMVQIRRGPVEILPELGQMIHAARRGSNLKITHRAERVAAAYWDGLNYHSVLVDLADGWAVGGTGE